MSKRQGGIASGRPATKSADTTDFSLHTADADGVKASTSCATEAQSFSGAQLDGALMSAGQIAGSDARNVTVDLDNTVGGFTAGSHIVIEGLHPHYGNPITESIEIPSADGNVSLISTKCFAAGKYLQITIPAAPNTNGSFEIGLGVARSIEPPARWFHANATGTIYAHLTDDNKIVKLIISTDGPKPFGLDALHAGTDITDLVPMAD